MSDSVRALEYFILSQIRDYIYTFYYHHERLERLNKNAASLLGFYI